MWYGYLSSTFIDFYYLFDLQLCVWSIDGWEKKKSRFIQAPASRAAPLVGDTKVQFHNDQAHLLVVHESQLAIYDSKLECLRSVSIFLYILPFCIIVYNGQLLSYLKLFLSQLAICIFCRPTLIDFYSNWFAFSVYFRWIITLFKLVVFPFWCTQFRE